MTRAGMGHHAHPHYWYVFILYFAYTIQLIYHLCQQTRQRGEGVTFEPFFQRGKEGTPPPRYEVEALFDATSRGQPLLIHIGTLSFDFLAMLKLLSIQQGGGGPFSLVFKGPVRSGF